MGNQPRKKRAERRDDLIAEAMVDTDVLRDRLHRLGALMFYLREKLSLQKRRLDANGRLNIESQNDIDEATGTLHHIAQTAEMAARFGIDVDEPREDLRLTVPQITDLRDILEHPEEYVLGIGDRQHDGLPLNRWYAMGNGPGTAVATTNPRVDANVGAALTAGFALADAVLHGVHDTTDRLLSEPVISFKVEPKEIVAIQHYDPTGPDYMSPPYVAGAPGD